MASRPVAFQREQLKTWRASLRFGFALYAIQIVVVATTLAVASGVQPLYAMMGGGGGGGGGGGHHGQHMKGITGSGTGTGSINCAAGSCSETANGKFFGTGLGTGLFTAALNFSNANPIDNGGGGACYGASGTIMLTAADGDTVSLGDVGMFCEVGSGPAPETFNGSYIIQSGTGTFSNSTGAGTIVLATDGFGKVYVSLNGAMGGGMGGGGM